MGKGETVSPDISYVCILRIEEKKEEGKRENISLCHGTCKIFRLCAYIFFRVFRIWLHFG